MTNQVRTDDAAPWKQRFRAPVTFAGLAKANPARGLATSNRSGVSQLYAWDVPTGKLRQITDRPEGKAFGYISPDGTSITLTTGKGMKSAILCACRSRVGCRKMLRLRCRPIPPGVYRSPEPTTYLV